MPSQYSRKHYNSPEKDLEKLREKIIGLGEESFRKSYYPELQQKLADLEKYKALLDQSNDAIFLIELPSGKFLDMSESACKQLDYTVDKCYAMTLFDMVSGHTEDLERIYSGEKGSLVLDAMLRKGNGELVPYEMNMRRVAFQNKEYLVVVARDITERKRAEEALRESEEKFRALAESSAAAIIVYQDGRLVSVNPAAERIIGYSKGELLKMRLIDIIHPDYKEMVLKRSISRQRGEPEPSQYETMIFTKSREARWVLLSVGLMLYRGKRAGVVTLLDITERKRAEEALRKSESHLAKSQEIAHLGSYNWDLIHNMDEWSDELYRILGIRPGAVKPSLEAYMQFVYPDDRKTINKHLDDMINKQKYVGGYEVRIVRPDGSIRWTRLDGEFMCDESGKVVRLFGTIMDITERKRAEEELARSKRQAELYLDLMGHDIRNYDQIALGYLELARDVLVKEPAEQELLSKPIDAINRSSRLIDNITKIQRVAGGKAYENKLMDICNVLDHVKAGYSSIPGRQVTINYHPIPECSTMANDLIYDMFTNLIDNSIRHTTPDKPLTIDIRVKKRAIKDKEYLKISIEDNGPGIADKQKEKLFALLEPGKTKASGRGLGLYLVKTLAESFGGSVRVEDRVTGDYHQGTRFIVVLPTKTK